MDEHALINLMVWFLLGTTTFIFLIITIANLFCKDEEACKPQKKEETQK